MFRRATTAAILVVLTTLGPTAQPAAPRFTVPDGFAVETVYAPQASGSIVAIAFDAEGRLVASRELGPVVRPIDRDGDGEADEEQIVTDRVTNAQGLEFDGGDLLVVGEGPEGPGLYRVPEAGGDGQGGAPRLLAATATGMQEHGPHAVFFGPDGWLYWILGNHTALSDTPDPDSPYVNRGEGQLVPVLTDPNGHAAQIRAPGGFIARRAYETERADWQIVAAGFRNAYDAAFNAAGELFTFDSDMEWDIGLPWYRPVRTYHVPPGAEFGWRTGTGKWAPYYPDALPGMRDVGRGSPTGVAFYQGSQFPSRYRDAFFQADWSRGRILVGHLSRTGATYREDAREFLLGTPLNVTDVEVGPDGALYFSKGGRKTEGGIYRVVYQEGRGDAGVDAGASRSWLDAALEQPHHRSAWGRAAIARARRQAGPAWHDALAGVARDRSADAARRVRALELLHTSSGDGAGLALLDTLAGDPSADVKSAAVYYLGVSGGRAARERLRGALGDDDAWVRRRALEALVRTGVRPGDHAPIDPVADLLPLLADGDRFVRYAARELLVRTNRNAWRDAALAIDSFPAVAEAQVALAHTATTPYHVRALLTRQLDLLKRGAAPADLARLLRAVHLTMARDQGVDLTQVYTPLAETLVAQFPSGDAALDRELALALASLQPAAAIPRLTALLREGAAGHEQQIWTAYALRRFERDWTPADRDAVAGWFRRTQDERWKGGVSFPGYLAQLWHEFVANQPAADREALIAGIPTLAPAGSRPGEPAPWRNRGSLTTLSERELLEYLELDPMAYQGSAEKGREVFEQAFCATCHRVGDVGQSAGPDLTDVGRRFRRQDILEAILYPSRTISDQWAAVEFVTRDKQSIVGTVRVDDGETVMVRTVAGEDVRLHKRDIASRTPSTVSAMPDGLLNGLSLQQVRDLLTFLERGPE